MFTLIKFAFILLLLAAFVYVVLAIKKALASNKKK